MPAGEVEQSKSREGVCVEWSAIDRSHLGCIPQADGCAGPYFFEALLRGISSTIHPLFCLISPAIFASAFMKLQSDPTIISLSAHLFKGAIRNFISVHLALLVGFLHMAPSLNAQATWNGATDTSWGTLTNWSTGALPTAAQIAQFNSNPPNAIATTVTTTVDGLLFGALATTNITMGTLGDGNIITLDGGATVDLSLLAGTGEHTINSTIAIGTASAQTWTNLSSNVFTAAGGVTLGNNITIGSTSTSGFVLGTAGGAQNVVTSGGDRSISVSNTGVATDLTIAGNLVASDTTNRTVTIDTASGAVAVISGNLVNGPTGSGALLKNGLGTLNLNGNRTATGTVTIYSGVFNMNGDNQASGTWDINGGTLNWNFTNTVNTGQLQFGESGLVAASLNIGAGIVYSLGGNIVTEHSSNNGPASTLNGPGTLNLNATRNIEVRDSTGVAAGSPELTISATLADGSAVSGFNKNRSGVLSLAGTNTFTGASTLNEGTLILDYTDNTDSKLADAAVLNLAGAALVLKGNSSAPVTEVVGSTVISGQGHTLLSLTNVTQPTTLQAGAITRAVNTGGTLDVSLPNANAHVTTTSANQNGILGGWATVTTPTGDFFATVTGGEIVALTPTIHDGIGNFASSFSPTATTTNGAAAGIGQNVSDSTGFTGTTNEMDVNSLRISGANALTIAESLNVRSGGILITSSSMATGISGGRLSASVGTGIGTATTANAGDNELKITHDGASNFTIGSSIVRLNDSNGSVDITKSGNGTLTLSGVNYTAAANATNANSGTVRLNQGTLIAAGGRAISDASNVSLENRPGVFLQLNSSEGISGLTGGGADGGTVAMGANTLTMNVGSSQTFSGIITGSGSLIKNNLGINNSNQSFNTNVLGGFTGALIVNGGLLQAAGNNSNFTAAASLTVNRTGAFLVDLNGTSANRDKLRDAATITLNGANGSFNTQSTPRGLAIRSDQNGGRVETLGAVTLATGASYMTAEHSNAAGANATEMRLADLTRSGDSTLSVRGTNLGESSGNRGEIDISNATNQAAFITANVLGGGGAAGTSTVSIVPWAIGQDEPSGGALATSATFAGDNTLGNSLVTYTAGTGFRPLDFATEYATANAGGGSTVSTNVREDLAGATVTVAATAATMNALVLNNDSTTTDGAFAGAGVGASLHVNRGPLLFTAVTTATGNEAAAGTAHQGITISGFDAGITVGGSEYVFFQNIKHDNATAAQPNVVGATAEMVTISSPLTSSAKIIKSGVGILNLTGVNTAGATGTTLNEGYLQINDLAAIGGDTGALIFSGGALRLATGFADDISSRTVVVNQNGGMIDTNGVNTTMANSITGTGELVKAGTGTLTLTSSAHTGKFTVQQTASGTATPTVAQLVLNNASGDAIKGDLQIGTGTTYANPIPSPNGSAVVQLGRSNQIADTATLSFYGGSSKNAYFKMVGFSETVLGIQDTSGGGVIENVENETTGTVPGANTNATLTIGGSQDNYFNGYLRNRSSGASTGSVNIVKVGTGTQTFAGTNILYGDAASGSQPGGTTTISNGTLRFRDTTGFGDGGTGVNGGVSIASGANWELERTNTTGWTYNGIISGAGDLVKTGIGTGATTLGASSTMTGRIMVNAGSLALGASGRLNDVAAVDIQSGATLTTTAVVGGLSLDGKLSGTGTVAGSVVLTSALGANNTTGLFTPGTGTTNATADLGNQLGNLTFSSGSLTITAGADANLQVQVATLNAAASIEAAIAGGYTPGTGTSTLSSFGFQGGWNTTTVLDAAGLPKHDTGVFTTGGIVWDTGSTFTVDSTPGWAPIFGDVIDLFDWAVAMTGTRDLGDGGTGFRNGGLIGDLDLPSLSGGLIYDVSLFASDGIIVVVPEPSRMILSFVGFAGLMLRRRRQSFVC